MSAADRTTDDIARVLAKHQLGVILPGGVACTCGAELTALNPPLDDGAIKGEPLALAVHQLQEIESADRPRCHRCAWCLGDHAPRRRGHELVCSHGFGCCQNCAHCQGGNS